MATPPRLLDRLRRLISEAHRRSLWQVLGLYVVGSWVGYQVILDLTQGVGLPDWVPPFAIVLFIIGLPVVLATAFVQEGLPLDRSNETMPLAPVAADPEPDQPEHRRRAASERPKRRLLTWPKAITAGVLAFALLGLGATGFLAMRTLGIGPAATLVSSGSLDERTPLVMSEFVALSGDSSLAAVVTEGLRADLEQSTFVTVADRTRIQETLRRMVLPADSRLDAATAREVALRLGLKALIEGEVGRAGGGYILTSSVVTADSGRTLATFRETADDSTQIVQAIGALSHDLREGIGESLKTVRASSPLTQVTTPSLPALRLAVESFREEVAGDRPRAIRLAEEALQLDSTFAWAWVNLAIYRYNSGNIAAALDAVDHALAHRDRLDDSRVIYVQALRAGMVGDHDAAIEEGREAVLRDSLNARAWMGLSDAYWNAGEWDQAAATAERAVDTAPENWVGHWNLVVARLDAGRVEAADSAVQRALSDLPGSQNVAVLQMLALAAREQWDSVHALGPGVTQVMSDRVRGHWKEAAHHLAESDAPGAGQLAHWFGVVDPIIVLGDTSGLAWLRARVDSAAAGELALHGQDLAQVALATAVGGDTETSRRARALYDAEVPEPARWSDAWVLHAADAFLALRQRNPQVAVADLRQARQSTTWPAPVDALLGRAYDALGQRDSAIAAYDRFLVNAVVVWCTARPVGPDRRDAAGAGARAPRPAQRRGRRPGRGGEARLRRRRAVGRRRCRAAAARRGRPPHPGPGGAGVGRHLTTGPDDASVAESRHDSARRVASGVGNETSPDAKPPGQNFRNSDRAAVLQPAGPVKWSRRESNPRP